MTEEELAEVFGNDCLGSGDISAQKLLKQGSKSPLIGSTKKLQEGDI